MRTNEHVSIEDIKSDIATLRSDVQQLTSGLARTGTDAAKDKLHAAEEKASDLACATKDAALDGHEKLGDSMKARPLTTLAVAFGAGALAARLMR